MRSEDVVMAEVREHEYGEDEEDEEDLEGGRRTISVGPIIAIVVVVIILAGIGLYIFTPPSVNGVVIIDPQDVTQGDDQRYGIELVMHVTSGVKSYSGTGALDITYDGSVVYTQAVKIRDDSGSSIIDYNKFVIENGVYEIRFSIEGYTAVTNYVAKMVPNNLTISVQYRTDIETGEVTTMAVVSPGFTYPRDPDDPDRLVVGDSIFYYSWKYDLETTFMPPVGDPITVKKPMWDYHRNRTYTKVWLPIEGDYMGYYRFSAKLINNLVKESSEYRELESEPGELEQYLNRDPELEDIDVPDRIRQNQEFSFTLRADDPDKNDRITHYLVDWDFDASIDDDPNTVGDIELFEVEEGGSSTVRVSHSYSTLGSYKILVTVADNGYVDDNDPPEVNYQKFDTAEFDIVVTRI